MRTQGYLLPPGQPPTKLCPDCYGEDENCERCGGTGEVLISDEYFDELRTDDERYEKYESETRERNDHDKDLVDNEKPEKEKDDE